MSEFRIASRYAKSLLDLAIEKNAIEEIASDMKSFSNACESNRELVLMVKNPVISHKKKFSVLKAIFEGKIHPITLSFFDIITNKQREQYLPEVAESFSSQYNDYKGIVESTITTVVPISEEIRSEVKSIVSDISKKEVALTEQLDANLIGGFVLRIGDRQIDESISNKLRELKLKFSERSFISQS